MPAWLAGIARWWPQSVLALLLLAWGWWLATQLGATVGTIEEFPPLTDIGLYQLIAERMAAGEGYYSAVAAEHRAHDYPLYPFYTVRLPTLAWLTYLVGADGIRWLAQALVVLNVVTWARRLHHDGFQAAEVVAYAILFVASSFVVFYHTEFFHAFWAALILSLAASFYEPEKPGITIFLVVIATLFREFVLLFLLIAACWTFVTRRWRELSKWLAGIAVVLLALAAHAWMVSTIRIEGDLVSQGWHGLNGLEFPVSVAVNGSLLRLFDLPLGGVLFLAAMAGWAAGPAGARLLGAFGAGFILVVALFARTENVYWLYMVTPWMLGGLAFFPRLVNRTVRLQPEAG